MGMSGARHVLFKDRLHAGAVLAELLAKHAKSSYGVILGLARGGVITAHAIGEALGTPVDVLVVKKMSSPSNPEFAIGAVGPDDVSIIHWKDAQRVGMDEAGLKGERERVSHVVRQLSQKYHKGRKPLSIRGKSVILTDDGAATGATMEAAVLWARRKGAGRITVALPVASVEAGSRLRPEAHEFVVYKEEANLGSIGEYYSAFPQVTDAEVTAALKR